MLVFSLSSRTVYAVEQTFPKEQSLVFPSTKKVLILLFACPLYVLLDPHFFFLFVHYLLNCFCFSVECVFTQQLMCKSLYNSPLSLFCAKNKSARQLWIKNNCFYQMLEFLSSAVHRASVSVHIKQNYVTQAS